MWISLTPLLLLLSPCQGVKTSCEIPEVEEGHDTTLTCKFSDDVRKLQQDYKVHFYRDNTTAVHDTVLDCVWLNNEPECRVNHCCSYDRNVSNALQVLVPKVTADNVGRYVCFVLPASQDSYEFCNFTLKIKETKLVEGRSNTLGALGVLAIIPIVIVIVIVIILMWKCNKCPKKKDGSEMCEWDPCHLCKKGNDDSKKNNSQHSGNISEPEEELLLSKKNNSQHSANISEPEEELLLSKKNNSQHSGNISEPEKKSLLPQPVGETHKQPDLTETDSCERTVKHKLEQGAEEGANTSEGISNTGNIKILDIDVHSDLTSLEGNDAHTATQESDISEQSAVPLQKPGDDTTDSKPHAAKRNPPLVTTESGGKSHPMMLPQNTKQGKKGGFLFWKSAGTVNNPQKALIKQYNRTAEDEEANRSKKKRSSKARKTLEQSKGGKSSKTTESVPPIINVESSQQAHIGAFSESLSLPQSSSSVNDNCTDISKTTIINQDEHSNADSSTEPRNILQDNNPTHGTNVSSCEIDMGTCTSTNDSEDSTGLTLQSGSRQPCTSSETAKEFTVTVNGFEQEVYGEETKPKPKHRILNVRFGSKGGKTKTKGKKPKDMATPQEP